MKIYTKKNGTYEVQGYWGYLALKLVKSPYRTFVKPLLVGYICFLAAAIFSGFHTHFDENWVRIEGLSVLLLIAAGLVVGAGDTLREWRYLTRGRETS